MSLEYLKKSYVAIVNDLNFELKKIVNSTVNNTDWWKSTYCIEKSLHRGRVTFVVSGSQLYSDWCLRQFMQLFHITLN